MSGNVVSVVYFPYMYMSLHISILLTCSHLSYYVGQPGISVYTSTKMPLIGQCKDELIDYPIYLPYMHTVYMYVGE